MEERILTPEKIRIENAKKDLQDVLKKHGVTLVPRTVIVAGQIYNSIEVIDESAARNLGKSTAQTADEGEKK